MIESSFFFFFPIFYTFHNPSNYWKYAHNFFILDHGKHRYFSRVTYDMSQECTPLQISVILGF